MVRRRSVGGFEGQAKVLGSWNIVDRNVNEEFYCEDEYGAVIVTGI